MKQTPTFRCPSCQGRNTRWQGYHLTSNEGYKHRRFCNHCSRTWYPKIQPYPWVKLWTKGILQGSVTSQLTKHEQLVWIKLLCVASECPMRGTFRFSKGTILSATEIAELMQEPADVVQSTINKCMADPNNPRLGKDQNGCYFIINWHRYQDNNSNSTSKKKGSRKESKGVQ